MSQNLSTQYAFLNTSSSGVTNIVSAQAGQRIIVLQCCVITGGTNTVNFATNTGGTAISANFPLATNGGFVLPYSQVGWFQGGIGQTLDINMSAGVATAIQVVWCPSAT
jgi:hypothetical protein